MNRRFTVLSGVFLAIMAVTTPARASAFLATNGYTSGPTERGGSELDVCDGCAAEATDDDGDGRVDRVSVAIDAAKGVVLTFAAGRGRALELGLYREAWQTPPGDEPTMQLATYHACRDDWPGAFEVLQADFDTSVRPIAVRAFLVRFALPCPGETRPFVGTLGVGDVDVPEIVWARYAPGSHSLLVFGERIEAATSLLVDGASARFKLDPAGGLRVKTAGLAPGPHEIRVGVANGYVSPPFTAWTDTAPFRKSTFVARSDPGDLLGGGGRYRFANPSTGLEPYFDPESRLAALSFAVDGSSGHFSLQIFAPASDPRLAVGTYEDASYSPSPDHATLIAHGVSPYGCQTVGRFTITDLASDTTGILPYVRWFGISYEARCENNDPALRATFRYRAPEPLRVIGVRYDSAAHTLRARGTDVVADTQLSVDGQLLGPTRLDGDTLVLGNLTLRPGRHLVALYDPRPMRYLFSQPWVFEVE